MGSRSSKENIAPNEHKNDETASNTRNCDQDYNFKAIDLLTNENEREIIKNDPDKLEKYKHDTSNFFYQYYSYYKSKKQWIEDNTQQFLQDEKNQEIRSKIRVLVIIGSYPDFQSLENDSNYFEDAEDFTTAFLICHIFHYAFLIPYSQILITTTKENGFKDKNTKTRYQDMDENTKISKISDLTFEFHANEFGFSQNVNYAQVGKNQYKFYLESDLLKRIKPFNHDIIINEINSYDKSDMFVFFLDHDRTYQIGFSEYQYFIDEFIQIPCFHYYVMNDSCYNGSLIEIIKASNDFENILSKKLDSKSEYNIIKLLITYGNFDSEQLFKQSILRIINQITKNKEFENLEIIFNDFYKNSEISSLFKFGKKISEIVHSDILFTPQNFALFGDKATIFSSSDYKNISLTLPARRISVLLNDNYRICGSVFASIFIESLLNANSSFDLFCSSIENLFISYKNDFENIIIYQNQNVKKEKKNIPNRKLMSKEAIESFFNMNEFKSKHIYIKIEIWPNLHSIFCSETCYWNVDTSIVDCKEYEKVFFCNLIKETNPKKNPNKYGPLKGMSSIEKYLIDYEDSVNQILIKKNYKNIKFSTCQPSIEDKENKYKDLNFKNWSQFVGSIRSYYSSKIGLGIMGLKYPIAIFFNDNPNFDKETGMKIFSEAFENIYPFWKDYSIYF